MDLKCVAQILKRGCLVQRGGMFIAREIGNLQTQAGDLFLGPDAQEDFKPQRGGMFMGESTATQNPAKRHVQCDAAPMELSGFSVRAL
jgi:hypothetical protein